MSLTPRAPLDPEPGRKSLHTRPQSWDSEGPTGAGLRDLGRGPQRDFIATLPNKTFRLSLGNRGKQSQQRGHIAVRAMGCLRSLHQVTFTLQQDGFRLDTRQHFLKRGHLPRDLSPAALVVYEGRADRQARAPHQWGPAFPREAPKDLSKSSQTGESSGQPDDGSGGRRCELGTWPTCPGRQWGSTRPSGSPCGELAPWGGAAWAGTRRRGI